ncbi:MAG TPA: NFACT RNA binding domain-containing protein, partial [Longimicrobiales bacterium]|nr:NFACT RNA binding domain-containing protein [Longimicrobiales bacterium]
ASLPEPSPRIVHLDRPTLYPLPLPGFGDQPVESLLAGMAAVGEADTAAAVAPEVRDALEARREDAARRAARLAEEASAAPEKAAALRHQADLLMAQLHRVERGAESVELDDFQGGTLAVRLDPRKAPAENAESLYDKARRRDRAAERLPARVREAEAQRDRITALLRDIEAGEADPDEVQRTLEEFRPRDRGTEEEDRLPYHSFRSSGGLEIRVGRSSRGNDELTFHNSSPHDIWLHARDMAGAHVILRWDDREQNPPRRDLVEAAVLAALNSRGRTSGTVPVDWTRRKYVRKAPPGAVLPDRVQTLFVEPDPALPERLG